jgi:hypothetical protein
MDAVGPGVPGVAGAELPLTNLLNDIDTLAPLLVDRVEMGDPLRPAQRWLDREADLMRRVAGGGGLAMVIDDPPRSWRSVIRAVAALGRSVSRRTGPHPAVLLRSPAGRSAAAWSRTAVPGHQR